MRTHSTLFAPTKNLRFAAVALFAAACAAVLSAGPMNPPAGAVTSTFKTLTEVEPRTAMGASTTPGTATAVFTITQPGSYYLTGNVTVPGGKNGIVVTASYVTIDLNGFSVIGQANSLEGITTGGASPTGVSIRNGAVANCGGTGINMVWVPSGQYSDLTLNANHGYGLATGNNSLVSRCVASNNTGAGFTSVGGGSFDRCSAYWNAAGFSCESSDTLTGCIANNNNGIGILVSDNSKVVNCQVNDNSNQGVVCSDDSLISGCQVHGNGGANMAGIWVQGVYNHVEGNDVVNNGYGIYVGGATNFIYRNKVGSSTQVNFYIVAGNHVGTITAPSTNATLIMANTSGGGMGSFEADPNANLVY